MNDPEKKENQEQVETGKNEKIPLSVDEMEKVSGGASFWLFDKENKKPKG